MNSKNKKVITIHLLLVTLSVILFVGLFHNVEGRTLPVFDQWSQEFLNQYNNPRTYQVFRWITELGSTPFITTMTVLTMIYLATKKNDPLAAVLFALAISSGYTVNRLIKRLVERQRPVILKEIDAVGYSFPSGHSMGSMLFFGLLIYFLIRHLSIKTSIWLSILCSSLILLIGISRYMIKAHYLTDVIGGFALGYCFIVIWIAIHQWIIRKNLKYQT